MNRQLTTKPIHVDGPLLPETMANLVTSVSLATRISLRCSSLFFDTLFEAAKYGTTVSLGISRNAITHAISTAKNIHTNQKKITCQPSQQEERYYIFYKYSWSLLNKKKKPVYFIKYWKNIQTSA